MSQPLWMDTDRYIGMGMSHVDGNDAWALMKYPVELLSLTTRHQILPRKCTLAILGPQRLVTLL